MPDTNRLENLLNSDKLPKVAVIIPVYNVERYLRECLDSVFLQTYPNIDVYAINDGSRDNSLSILREYSERYDNLVVFDRENGGLSSARNACLKAVADCTDKPKYIAFFDSDDVLPKNYFKEMVSALEAEDADLAVADVCEFDAKERFPMNSAASPFPRTLCGDDVFRFYFGLESVVEGFSCNYFVGNKLFRYELVADCYFSESMRTAEDLEWLIHHALPRVRKAVVVAEACFFYRLRKSSLSHGREAVSDRGFLLKTFENVAAYPLPARKALQHLYIREVYARMSAALLKGDDALYGDAMGRLRDLTFRRLEFPVKWRDRKKFLIACLPHCLSRLYFRKKIVREKVVPSGRTFENFFE